MAEAVNGQRTCHPQAASDFVTLAAMGWETLTLDARARHRLYVLNRLLAGEITATRRRPT